MAVEDSAELSKQLQDLHIDVALFSETRLKPGERFLIPIYPYLIKARRKISWG
jgi:hypothetical protein